MKELILTVSVDEDLDYIGDVDISVPMEDDMFNQLFSVLQQHSDKDEEFTEDDLSEQFPDIYNFISNAVDEIMPSEIDMDEDQDIDDFMWSIQYPEDLCEWLECY